MGLSPGDPVPAYQLPSKFAKDVVRTLANPDFEPRTSQSRTPHHLLDGMITPNGVFFTIVHGGVPAMIRTCTSLLIHGLVKRPLVFTPRRAAALSHDVSRLLSSNAAATARHCFRPSRCRRTSRPCTDWSLARNGLA